MSLDDPKAFFEFWGKARPTNAGARSHSAAFHCFDVAAVADQLLRARPLRVARLAEGLGVIPEEARRWLITWIALHDIGKFSRAFQIKAPDLWPAALGPLEPRPAGARHDELGRWMLAEALQGRRARVKTAALTLEQLTPSWCQSVRMRIIDAVTGHHGRPPNDKISFRVEQVGEGGFRAAADFIVAAHEFFLPTRIHPPKDLVLAGLSWEIAALTVISDWVGSNERWFRYENAGAELPDLAIYWAKVAEPRARKAVVEAGLAPARIAITTGLAALAPEVSAHGKPTHLQRWAETVTLPQGPVLAILEDITGSGKTEAALVLGHRLMQQGKGSGLYVALPTMATANAMFERLKENYLRLFDGGKPSLALAHSARWLSASFEEVRLAGERGEVGDDAGTSGAQCAAWIADDRRKAFLADVGVGTIDQAILAVLPVKHQALRLWGLPERVLIIDEVHAYDAFMLRELEVLIEFQVALGGSVILLSATLPARMKHCLAKAFTRARRSEAANLTRTEYPLATLLGGDAPIEEPCAPRADLVRRIGIERIANAHSAVQVIAEAARAGAAVAWIRNTVDDAIAGARRLHEEGLEPTLFHARFVMGDRLAREAKVLERFGKASQQNDRRGQVLVGSQVLEQSLDVDFDLIVSDLAPIDLLIQRAGRLWRHTWRERVLEAPKLCVVSPEPGFDAERNWFTKTFPLASHVYENHAQLWVTARELFAGNGLNIPGDVRRFVETVYSKTLPDAPASLQLTMEQGIGRESAKRSLANINLLKFRDGYRRELGLWDSEEVAPTRIGDKRRRLRLARIVEDRIVPLRAELDRRRAWALSEVSVRAYRVKCRCPLPPSLELQARAIEAEWGEYDSDVVLVVLQSAAGSEVGFAFDERDTKIALKYGDEGLSFISFPLE